MNSETNIPIPENDFEKFANKYNKNKLDISFNRIAFIFFIFVLVLLIFSLKAFYLTEKISQNNIIGSKKKLEAIYWIEITIY